VLVQHCNGGGAETYQLGREVVGGEGCDAMHGGPWARARLTGTSEPEPGAAGTEVPESANGVGGWVSETTLYNPAGCPFGLIWVRALGGGAGTAGAARG
jgi:hypothetical protein